MDNNLAAVNGLCAKVDRRRLVDDQFNTNCFTGQTLAGEKMYQIEALRTAALISED